MKKLSIFLISTIFVAGLFIGFNAIAQETTNDDVAIDEEISAEDLGVSEPTILPGDTLYGIKDFWQKVKARLTFSNTAKAELRLKYASEKLLEAKKLAEQAGNEEMFQQALGKYQQQIEALKDRIELFREKAADNPKLDKFLDKYSDRIIKQEKIIEKLEEKFAEKPEILAKLKENRQRTLEHLGDTLNRLEDKDKITERLDKVLENIKGGKYKNFKNLEILKQLESKVPEQAKEAIKQAQENALKRLHNDLENMSPEDQDKFQNYLENITGNQETKTQIMEQLGDKIQQQSKSQTLKNKTEQIRNQIKEKIKEQAKICKNSCGDGVCQEIVCQAEGCPCAETKITCQQDCK